MYSPLYTYKKDSNTASYSEVPKFLCTANGIHEVLDTINVHFTDLGRKLQNKMTKMYNATSTVRLLLLALPYPLEPNNCTQCLYSAPRQTPTEDIKQYNHSLTFCT